MSNKFFATPKNIKVFSSFSLPALKDDVTYGRFVVKVNRSHRSSWSYYSHDIVEKDNFQSDYFILDIPENKEIISKYYEDKDSLFSDTDCKGIMSFAELRQQHSMSYTHITCGIPNDKKLAKTLYDNNGHPFVTTLMGIDESLSVNEKVTEITRRDEGLFRLGSGYFNEDFYFSLKNYLKISEKLDDGKTLQPISKNSSNYHSFYKNYSIKKYGEFQKHIIWINLFNELSNIDDENKTLGELLEDNDFVNNVQNRFSKLEFIMNDYSMIVYDNFMSDSSPSNINYLKTLKARDKFLSFTKKDLNVLKESKNPKNNAQKIKAKKIETIVNSSTPNMDTIVENWLSLIRDEESENSVTSENLRNTIAYAELRNKAEIFKSYNPETGIDDNFIATKVNIVSPIEVLSELPRNKISVFIRILNILGVEYVRNEIKLSHLQSLLLMCITPSTFVSSANTEWIERFIIASIGDKEMTSDYKELLLDMLLEIYLDFKYIKTNLRILKKDSLMFDTYSTDIPMKLVLNMLGIENELSEKSVNLPIRVLHKQGF